VLVENRLRFSTNTKYYRTTFSGSTYKPYYIGIAYNTDISKKYEDYKKKSFCISGMKIWENRLKKKIKFEVYFNRGLISGVDAEMDLNQCDLDFSCIDSDLLKIIEDQADNELKKTLETLGIASFNASELDTIVFQKMPFIRLRDLEDGDFLSVKDEGFFIFDVSNKEMLKIPEIYNDEIKKRLRYLTTAEIYSYL
jgi:hypothetical protein